MANEPTLEMVKLKDITFSKTNPRKTFDEDSIQELAESIREKGVLQPVLLRKMGKGYELVCGERRCRAAKIVNTAIKTRDSIPATIHELTDEEAMELQIIENLQRKDVHPMDEAMAFKALIDLKKHDATEIANRVGKSVTYVLQRLKFVDLCDGFQKAFYQDRLSIAEALRIVKLRKEDQEHLWENEFQNGEGRIEISRWTYDKYMNNLAEATFDITNAKLLPGMGACVSCQFNTGSNALLFPEDVTKAKCSYGECFRKKTDINFEDQVKIAASTPGVILIDTNYGGGDVAKALTEKGYTIYPYSSYEYIQKPQEKEPKIEDYELDNYEDQQELEDDFNSDLANYKKEMEEYEQQMASSKVVKAFVADAYGNKKGTYVMVVLKEGSEAKTNAKGFEAKMTSGEATADDIKAEIARLTLEEEKKQAGDEDKVHAAICAEFKTTFVDGEGYLLSNNSLTKDENIALILTLCDRFYHTSDYLHNDLGIEKKYSGGFQELYNYLISKSDKEITKVLTTTVRSVISSHLQPVKSYPDQRPSANGKAAAISVIAKEWIGENAKDIEMSIKSKAVKREERFEGSIKWLKEELAKLEPTKKTPAAKKSKATVQ